MTKSYWVAHVDIHDKERYMKYMEANGRAFAKFNGKFLVRGGVFDLMEGKSRERTVVVEFPSHDQALACWHSPEYQAAMKFRLPVSTADLAIIEGYDGPQPA